MRVLLLSPLTYCSGNTTTICRLRGHFEKNGIQCILKSPESFTTSDDFLSQIHLECVDLILAIHAYKSGLLLKGCKVPYILILGGTDVNECTEDADKLAVMTQAIQIARHIVCFGTSLKNKFVEKWPDYSPANVSIIPQAVDTKPSNFNIRKYIQNNIQSKQLNEEISVFVVNGHNDDLSFQNNSHDQTSGKHDKGKQFHDSSTNHCTQSQDDLKQSHHHCMQSHDQLKQSHDYCIQSHDHCIQSHDHLKLSHDHRGLIHNDHDKSYHPPCKRKQSSDLYNQSHDQSRLSHDHCRDSHDQYRQLNDQTNESCYIVGHMCNNEESQDNPNTSLDSIKHKCNGKQSDNMSSYLSDIIETALTDKQSKTDFPPIQDKTDKYCHHGNASRNHPQIENFDAKANKVEEALFFTIVGGIRPVKNQLFLVKEFSDWAKKKAVSCYLLIIGPKMDDEYFCKFEEKISGQSNVIYVPGLSLQDTHAAIRDSFALVNTSHSEGMAISILEAMCLNTPVLARDIPGNKNVVQDRINGLLFHTTQDFFTKADILLNQRDELERLSSNAYRYILQNHSMKSEEEAYMRIIHGICATHC